MARIRVEDNEMNVDMLSRRLQHRGFEIIPAWDGMEGIEKAASEKPDLILLNLSLPIINGWEATRQLGGARDENHSHRRPDGSCHVWRPG